MSPEQIKQYILAERKKGTPDAKIYDAIKKQSAAQETAPTPEKRGFWGELLPSAFAVGGGIIGGIAGAPLGPAGIVGGGIAGAGAGGAIGEGIQQRIEVGYGQRDKMSAPQIAATGAISAGGQALGVGAVKLAGAVAKPVINASKQPIISTLKFLSGYEDDVINRALQRTPGTVAGLQKGEASLDDIVKSSAQKISELAKEGVRKSRETVATLSKMSGGGAGMPGTRQSFLKEGTQFVTNITNTLRTEHNVGVSKTGALIFDRASKPSRFVSGGDRAAIQSAFDSVRSITKDTSIGHINAVMERLIALKTKTPVGSPTGAETKAAIEQMMSSVKSFADSLGRVAPAYKQYVKFLDENLPRRVMIEDAKELFGGTANLSAKEVSKTTNQLLQMFNSGRNAVRGDLERIGSQIGEDPIGAVAGVLTNGPNVSQRAANLTTRGLFEKVVEYLPRKALQNYIETGKLTSELLNHEKIKALATVLDISAKAVIQEIANLSANKTTR